MRPPSERAHWLLAGICSLMLAGLTPARASDPGAPLRKPAGSRVQVVRITVELEDGQVVILDGDKITDPKGGVLVWNDFGVRVLESFYRSIGDHGKADKALMLWHGQAGKQQLPSVMIKPLCDPNGWP